VEVRALLEILELKFVASPIVSIAYVHRLVQILDEMDHESKRFLTLGAGAMIDRRACCVVR